MLKLKMKILTQDELNNFVINFEEILGRKKIAWRKYLKRKIEKT